MIAPTPDLATLARAIVQAERARDAQLRDRLIEQRMALHLRATRPHCAACGRPFLEEGTES